MCLSLSDEQITTDEGVGAASNQSDANQVDENEGLRKQIRKEIEDDIVQQLLEERSDSGVYKGIQRVVSKKDKQYENLNSQYAKQGSELQELKRQFNDAIEMFNYSSGVLYQNLPDNERQRVSAEIAARNTQRMQAQVEDMRRQMSAGSQSQVQPPQSDEFQEILEKARTEANDALRETASQFGIDPSDSALDYGDPDETFGARLKKLNKSLTARRKELDAQDKEAVKPKVAVTPTRTGSGSGAGVPDSYGRTTLQRGSAKILERVREQMAAGR